MGCPIDSFCIAYSFACVDGIDEIVLAYNDHVVQARMHDQLGIAAIVSPNITCAFAILSQLGLDSKFTVGMQRDHS